MKGKVKCTCGWSWNKSDSSKKDMYICHECGRDNSNNMKNGGWLDNYGTQENYNDYKVSAPEGMVGDGFSNVGRNYSPAWGGQFQEGGEIPNAQKGKKVKPIYVESKNDPRYKAYNDSLRLYTQGQKQKPIYNSHPEITKEQFEKFEKWEKEQPLWGFDEAKYKKDVKSKKFKNFDDYVYDYKKYQTPEDEAFNKTVSDTTIVKGNKQYIYPTINGKIDKDAAYYVIDTQTGTTEFRDPDGRLYQISNDKIKPINSKYTGLKNPIVHSEISTKELSTGWYDKKTPPPSKTLKSSNSYKNYSHETEQFDFYKKPQQPVIVKPTTTKETTTKKPAVNTKKKPIVDPNNKPLVNPTKLNVEGLKPMSVAGLQDVDNRFETNLDIPTPVQRKPKYYNITDVNNQYGGGDTTYRVDSLDELRELPKELWDRKITPQYQMGGNIYPVNYVPQAQGGMSMPGAVGFSYARIGAPSKGPRRNQTDVTDASAQNGKEMQYYREGLDWKPKTISREGSIIKDDRGQWAHPGEITEIDSPYITMQGVPYPVLGISDTGDMQMMYPEEEYEFDGEKVTEYPMAKNGRRQEQKGLVNLDNLLNFTNYNTKQPGGWLDTL
jgi:hypothetical protein